MMQEFKELLIVTGVVVFWGSVVVVVFHFITKYW